MSVSGAALDDEIASVLYAKRLTRSEIALEVWGRGSASQVQRKGRHPDHAVIVLSPRKLGAVSRSLLRLERAGRARRKGSCRWTTWLLTARETVSQHNASAPSSKRKEKRA